MKSRNWRPWQIVTLSALVLLFTCACLQQSSPQVRLTEPPLTPQPSPQAQATDLWSLLQQNPTGYVVVMRHAIAPGTGDPPGFRLDDCRTQRNLSAAGRQQAKKIGQAFRDRKIRIHQVLSS